MRAGLYMVTILSLGWANSHSAMADGADVAYHASEVHAPNAKRLIVECMNKRMTASRNLSYNEATRICTDQVKDQQVAQASVTASSPPQKAVSAP